MRTTRDNIRRRRRQPGQKSSALASMIDVCFLLLVYFVATSAFVAGEGVLTAKFPTCCGPETDEAHKPPTRPIRIALTATDAAGYRLSINDGAFAPRTCGELSDLMAQWRGSVYAADNPVILEPRAGVRWTHVVNAFNAAVRAGYENVVFAQAQE